MAPLTFSPFIGPAGMLGFFTFDITRKGGFFWMEKKHFSEEQIAFGQNQKDQDCLFCSAFGE